MGGPVILIVDDYQDGAEALCRVLMRKGYPCQWVPGGREALAMIRAHPPEQPLLIVLDEMMPDISGMEVLREVRRDPKIANTTIIFHSAGFDTAKRDEAMTLGVVAWLLKGGTWALELNGPVDTISQWYERVGGVRKSTAAGEKGATKDARSH
jgi:CheY-like chemotaxis protein